VTPAKLVLEDGAIYAGQSRGATGEALGEVVFNTSMTGYQEVLTDPSYRGQIVAMTYPHIGNYGVNPEDCESRGPQVQGFVARDMAQSPSNFRATRALDDYLKQNRIVAIEGIDTRALVCRIRAKGAMRGIISTEDSDDASLLAKARAYPGMLGRDLVREIVPKENFNWDAGFDCPLTGHTLPKRPISCNVVAIDYGLKWNILRYLHHVGCRLTVVPGTATAEEILAHRPDGIFLSNGPGDPGVLDYAVAAVRGLIGKKPIFGICLGHQILGQAFGAQTFKLKFGHRGANQPVLNRQANRVEITTQNHGFAVDLNTLPAELEATHINLNDGTLEGMRHRSLPIMSVQYHPEASAGPHDSAYLFEEFRSLMA
jgi:carbamoyl-phosphate synthase small subunit